MSGEPGVTAVWEYDDAHPDGEPTMALYFTGRDYGTQCIHFRLWSHAVIDLGEAMAKAIHLPRKPIARHPGGEINHRGDGFAD